MPNNPPAKCKLPELSGWGRFPRVEQTVVRPEKAAQLAYQSGKTLARGQGRSYGDAALNSEGVVLLTERLNRFLEFDEKTGVLQAEAGATLERVLEAMVPRGWFLPVTPGTKFCSLGGCVATDVHGKNHHRDGPFSNFVREIELVLPGGETVKCSREERADLYWATVGGMGLTGVISTVTLQLKKIETAYMKVNHRQAANLDVVFNLLQTPACDDVYSVCWLDCLAKGKHLGRGVLMTAHHAKRSEIPLMTRDALKPKFRRQRRIKRDWPTIYLNRFTVGLFNALYYRVQGRRGEFHVDYDRFFYPLDAVNDWNRMYGKAGFVQYQFVVPTERAREAVRKAMLLISKFKRASFLAVLKRFGPAGKGLLSFPAEGYTLAVDLPVCNALPKLLKRLDEIVLEYGGRVYLAKDACLPVPAFKAMYPKLDEFLKVKREVDPENRFSSDLARRLEIAP
ncbi:MAG: FAD-binding oxidoreductase [Armatimonadetes bacterium]|nr:FAD-binding oxidoreductase [Armatimonadota bacterium]